MKTKFNKSIKKVSIFLLFLSIFTLVGCLGNGDGEAQTSEEILNNAIANINFDQLNNDLEEIDEIIESFGLTEEILIEPNGVRYRIQSLGTGAKPRLNSTVRIKYSGRLLDSNVEIDANDDLEIALFSLIIGFQTTLPLLPEGTVVTLFIPSGFGMPSNGVGT